LILKIALEVGRLHQIQRSVFARAEIPEELIWNSGTQELRKNTENKSQLL
jgi:hypothetical protein